MTQTIKNVWLYSDAHASMHAAAAVALEVSRRHGAFLTLLTVAEASDNPRLGTLGQELMRLAREDRRQRLENWRSKPSASFLRTGLPQPSWKGRLRGTR